MFAPNIRHTILQGFQINFHPDWENIIKNIHRTRIQKVLYLELIGLMRVKQTDLKVRTHLHVEKLRI